MVIETWQKEAGSSKNIFFFFNFQNIQIFVFLQTALLLLLAAVAHVRKKSFFLSNFFYFHV